MKIGEEIIAWNNWTWATDDLIKINETMGNDAFGNVVILSAYTSHIAGESDGLWYCTY